MKRILSFLLALVMVAGMLPAQALAAPLDALAALTDGTEASAPETEAPETVPTEAPTEPTQPEPEDVPNGPGETEPEETVPAEVPVPETPGATRGECGGNLIWAFDGVGTLTISGTGAMYDYRPYYNLSYYAPWYSIRSSIQTVIVGHGVSKLGSYSFYGCNNLTLILMPSSLTSLGDGCFDGCTSLTSFTIPASITNIGECCFRGCESLTSITIPTSITRLERCCFMYCNSLTDITIPDSVTSLGLNCFYGCKSLTSITIPAAVTSLGEGCFNGCTSLTSIIIPEGITSLDAYFFDGCRSLTSVALPQSLTSLGYRCFEGCTSLTSITLPDSLTTIRNQCFEDCTGLTSISIPSGVTSLGASCFSGCIKLTSVTIPDSVTSLGDSCFAFCYALTSITIPDSVTSIGSLCFRECNSLTSITIPAGITSMGRSVFYCCRNLATVTIRDGATSLGDYCFQECNNLTSVTIPGSITALADYCFYECRNLSNVTIQDGVTSLGEGCFDACVNLSSITIPDSIASLGSSCLSSRISNIFFEGDAPAIASDAFSYVHATAYYHADNPTWTEDKKQNYGGTITWVPYGGSSISVFSDEACTQKIEEFTNSYGSLTFDTDRTDAFHEPDWSSFFLKVTIDLDSASDAITPCTLTLPAGFSFEEWSIVTSREILIEPGATEKNEVIEVYPQYVPMTGDTQDVTFTLSGPVSIQKSVTMNRNLEEGLILCRPTDKVNKSTDPIEVQVALDPVQDFVVRDVNAYSENLALIECALTQSIYGISNGDSTQIERSLLNLGFSKIWYAPSSGDSGVACAIAQKKLIVDGEVRNAMMIVIRGTFGTEWIGDFMVNTWKDTLLGDITDIEAYHSDFWMAAQETKKNIQTYLSMEPVPEENTRAHVCGHSRGAAVANILCLDINKGKEFSFKDMTSYNFATPNSISEKELKKYGNAKNVHNIMDDADLVAFVPQNYYKYGQTYVQGMNAKKYPSDVKALLTEYAGQEISRPNNDLLKSIAYWGGEKGNELLSNPEIATALGKALSGTPVIQTDIAKAHGAENYLAWVSAGISKSTDYDDALANLKEIAKKEESKLLSLYGGLLGDMAATVLQLGRILFDSDFSFLKVSCPVNVEICDSNGNILASFQNHKLVAAGENVLAWSEGESDCIVFPNDVDYTVYITGTDNGTMDIGLLRTNSELEDLGTVLHSDVPVTLGTTYTLSIQEDSKAEDWNLDIPEPTKYSIIQGAGQRVRTGKAATFVSNADYSLFAKVQVDGVDLPATCYTVASGSTKVTLLPDYTETLADGGHTLTIVSTDGEARTRFTVTDEVSVQRISGTDRHATAFKIADMLKSELGVDKFSTMIIASGSDSADALAGSYLAARTRAPILLSRGSSHQRNLEYIQANLAPGGTVYILGGTAAVPEEMENLLKDNNILYERLKGKTRFDTNLAILDKAGVVGDEILVSTGYNFADSLSASASGKPILLVHTNANVLTDSQKIWLEGQRGKTFTIIGGTGAVSEKLETELQAYGTTARLKGSGREATSVEVAKKFFTSPDTALLAYSRNFPDGLCGGPLAYAMGAPLLLVNAGKEADANGYVNQNGIRTGYILGGTGVISDDTARTVFGLDGSFEIPKQ